MPDCLLAVRQLPNRRVPVRAVAAADLDRLVATLDPDCRRLGRRQRTSRRRRAAVSALSRRRTGSLAWLCSSRPRRSDVTDPRARRWLPGSARQASSRLERLSTRAAALPISAAAALAFALGAYRFTRYRGSVVEAPQLVTPAAIDGSRRSPPSPMACGSPEISSTPRSNDMGPAELASAPPKRSPVNATARSIRGDRRRRASVRQPADDPYAVGIAAAPSRSPRLVDISWGDPGPSQSHPRRQGRLLRHRRPRHQAGEWHAVDEEGHGRRRQRPRSRPYDHGKAVSRSGCASSSPPSRTQSQAPRFVPATFSRAATD